MWGRHMGRLFHCPFCERKYINKDGVLDHMDKMHNDELCGLTPKQIYFNYTNHYALTKGFGKSVISGKPTPWNEKAGRYMRFLPEEKEKYRALFLANMKRAGKENIMKDMEHQKEMLANRGISGKYVWSDGTVFTYTGSYEKKFLEFLDNFMEWPSKDIMAPAPQIIPYKKSDGSEHAHIPDFYIVSLNLLVNVKSSDNKHYRLRDIETERAQDDAIKRTTYNYLKLYDNNFGKFNEILEKIRNSTDTDPTKKIVLESYNSNILKEETIPKDLL